MAAKSIILSLRKPTYAAFTYRDILFPRQIVAIQQVNCLHSSSQLEKQHSKVAKYNQYDGSREFSKFTIAEVKPVLRKVEKFTFIVLAKAKNAFYIVKGSNEYRIFKESLFKTLIWAKDSFNKHILQNSKVQQKVKVFKDKVEEASQQIELKKRK